MFVHQNPKIDDTLKTLAVAGVLLAAIFLGWLALLIFGGPIP